MDETAVFGIALGTASASIALSKVREIWKKSIPCCWLTQGSKTEILANHAGERTTPTLVSYRDSAEVGHVTSRGALYSAHTPGSGSCSQAITASECTQHCVSHDTADRKRVKPHDH